MFVLTIVFVKIQFLNCALLLYTLGQILHFYLALCPLWCRYMCSRSVDLALTLPHTWHSVTETGNEYAAVSCN